MPLALGAVLLCLLSAGGAWPQDPADAELRPISAAEAGQRVTEAKDFLAELLWGNTEAYWHSGRWDECIRLCRQIVQVDPHFVEAYTGAAWMLWNLDRDEEAIEVFRAGIAANPESYEVYHEFGMYYWQRHKWDEAAEMFRGAVENNAPQALQRMLPNALEKAGRKQEALGEWRELLKRFPDDPIAKRHIDALEKELSEEKKAV